MKTKKQTNEKTKLMYFKSKNIEGNFDWKGPETLKKIYEIAKKEDGEKFSGFEWWFC